MNLIRKCLDYTKCFTAFFMNLSIAAKMLLGYMLVILLPVTVLGVYFQFQTTQNFIGKYATGKQQLMEQAYSTFKGKMSQIEFVYQLFQYNSSVMNFINGYYTTEADEMYIYLKDIKPLFSYVHVSNSLMNDVTIYKYRSSLIDFKHDILDANRFQGNRDMIQNISPGKGLWVYNEKEQNNIFSYYQKYYNSDFSKETGFIEVTVKSNDLLDLFNTNAKNETVLLNRENNWFLYKDHKLQYVSGPSYNDAIIGEFFRNMMSSSENAIQLRNNVIVNSLSLKELNAKIFLLTPENSIINNAMDYLSLLNFAILLLILSVIYYIIVSSVTRRLTKLARHMRKTDYNNLVEFKEPGYKDEVGLLITSYNAMIGRINNLINSVFKAELRKKEADFYALQAQIKPHFLYNTLETIRMMAEANEDTPVADVTYSLGRFMRYNMSRKNDETFLTDEVENVKNYMKIYKVSMGERLSFKIEVNAEIKGFKCPGFILQPLVENCLHHGLSNIRKRLAIAVGITEDEECIIISISDNGSGIPEDRLKMIRDVLKKESDPSELQRKENGIGIVNVNERVKSYYGEKFELLMESVLGEGTACTLRLGKKGRVIDYADNDCR